MPKKETTKQHIIYNCWYQGAYHPVSRIYSPEATLTQAWVTCSSSLNDDIFMTKCALCLISVKVIYIYIYKANFHNMIKNIVFNPILRRQNRRRFQADQNCNLIFAGHRCLGAGKLALVSKRLPILIITENQNCSVFSQTMLAEATKREYICLYIYGISIIKFYNIKIILWFNRFTLIYLFES